MPYLTAPDRYALALGQVLSQFKNNVVFIAFLESLFNRIKDTDDILDQLSQKRDLNNATGVWLDIIGDIVGVPRPNKDYDPALVFTLRASDWITDPNKAIKNVSIGGVLQSDYGLPDPSGDKMEDSKYLELIKAKISATNVIGTLPDIFYFFHDGFNYDPILSEGDCVVNVSTLNGLVNDSSFDLGFIDWYDNSTAPSYLSWNGANKSLELHILTFDCIGDYTLTDLVIDKDYIIFVDVVSTTPSLYLKVGNSLGDDTYVSKSLNAIGKYCYNFKVTQDTVYIRLFATGVTAIADIAQVEVFPFLTQIQRVYCRKYSPISAGIQLYFTDWPAI